jgi:branched-chain amino acid transport system substrate-binding protein
MIHTRRQWLGAALAGAAAGTFASGKARAQAAPAPIRVAVVGPLTGAQAAFGAQMKLGAEQVVADINGAGGVLNRQLALEIGDDACDPR